MHLFVFWFALVSTITPPVCGGVFIAASMVEENWLRVAWTAITLGLGLYIIPLAMVQHPEIILTSTSPFLSILTAVQIAFGLILVSHAIIGHYSWSRKLILMIAGSFAIFAPNPMKLW